MRVALRVALTLLLASCVDTGAGAPSSTATIGGLSPAASPRIGPAVVRDATVLLTGLEIPWAVDLAPDGRLFITERPGRIRVARFDGRTATLEPEPWAVVGARANPNGEWGLLGLVLDPDFARNGFVYVYYSYAGPDNATLNKLVRMRDENGKGVEDEVLLDGIAGSTIHDGGRVKFGPDGKLYVTTGDGAVTARAQDPGSLNGKILRINADGTIPTDNPMPGSAVWSLGHRNVQGIAFHPDTGVPYATEHGPSARDEVNRIERGANYGWPLKAGQEGDPRFVDPVASSGLIETWAPSGATFLARPGPLRGSYLFATLRGQHLHRIVFGPDGRTIAFEEKLLLDRFGRLRDVFELPSGQLLVLTNNRDGRGRPAPDDDRVILVTLG